MRCNETIFSTAETVVDIPETMFTAFETMFSMIKTMFFVIETTVGEIKTLFSGAKPIFCASATVFSIAEKMEADLRASVSSRVMPDADCFHRQARFSQKMACGESPRAAAAIKARRAASELWRKRHDFSASASAAGQSRS
jgi:hypothetical protein